MDDLQSHPYRRRTLGGVVLSLGAAAAFGVFTPAAKGAATHLGPLRAAGLTYLIAGIVALSALALRHEVGLRSTRTHLVSRHAWRLAGMTWFDGILGPALFF